MQSLKAPRQPLQQSLQRGTLSEGSLDASDVAIRLLADLDRSAIPYCVLGDTRQFPEAIHGDLDLVIEPSALRRLPELLARFCTMQRIDLVQCWQHQSTCFCYVLSWRHGLAPRRSLGADFCGDFLRNARLFLSAEELLAGRRTACSAAGADRGFFVPAPRDSFIYYLLKKVDKLHLDESQAEYLSAVWYEDAAGASAQVRRFWAEPAATVLNEAARSGVWDEVRIQLPGLRAELYRRLPRSGRFEWAEVRRKLRRFLYPTGLQVAVLGLDGTGKSSVITELIARGVPGFRRIHYAHFRPAVGRPESEKPAAEPHAHPHGAPPRSRVGSIAKLLYYVGDYIAGYALRTRQHTVHSGLVFFDRYYHDLLVDPERYRYGGSATLARGLGALVPRPDRNKRDAHRAREPNDRRSARGFWDDLQW